MMDEEYLMELRREAIEIAKNDIVPNNYRELRSLIFSDERGEDYEVCQSADKAENKGVFQKLR